MNNTAAAISVRAAVYAANPNGVIVGASVIDSNGEIARRMCSTSLYFVLEHMDAVTHWALRGMRSLTFIDAVDDIVVRGRMVKSLG